MTQQQRPLRAWELTGERPKGKKAECAKFSEPLRDRRYIVTSKGSPATARAGRKRLSLARPGRLLGAPVQKRVLSPA